MADMEGFVVALRAAMATELEVEPEDILDVRVEWDDGDRYDPTYGDSPNSPPKFRVIVLTKNPAATLLETRREISVDFTFTALLRLCLGLT